MGSQHIPYTFRSTQILRVESKTTVSTGRKLGMDSRIYRIPCEIFIVPYLPVYHMGFGKTHDIGDLVPEMEGAKVGLGGWVEDIREMGKMTFLIVRDSTGGAQVVVKGALNEDARRLTRQSVISVSGTVQKTRARDYRIEVAADEIDVLAEAAHPLPIDPTGRLPSSIDNRLNARALDMRDKRTSSIFRIRHHVMASLRDTFNRMGFTEITTPKIIGSASEGGANLFSLEYFGKTAYLAQSPQLYKEQMTMGLGRVFEISSFYRAEKSHTGRHLTEFTSVDIEAAFMDHLEVMDVLEELVIKTCCDIAKECRREQDEIGFRMPVPDAGFERVTYSQAVGEIADAGQDIKFGDDLADAHLRIIGERHPGFYFLTDWPQALKPFYIMESRDDPTISRSFDLQYGYLELSSGGTRMHDPEALRTRLQEQGLDPRAFVNHLRTFEWGMPPHSGWGLGLDRLVAVLTGTDNVRETVLYPRDPERLLP